MAAGEDPNGPAAATSYIAWMMNEDGITEGTMVDAAGATSVTIRNRYKGLMGLLNPVVSDLS